MPTPSPGDILSRTSGLVTHYGTAVDSDQVLDIVPRGPPRIVSLERFADGKPVSLRRSHVDDLPSLLARVRQAADSQRLYDPVAFNCEHLKNFIRSGEEYSETVLVLGLVAVVGFCVLRRGRVH